MKLYKITAHYDGRSCVYYVVAATTTKAEEAVTAMHKKEGYSDVDWFDSETVAEASIYGSPAPLIIT